VAAITTAEILVKLSIKTGAAGNAAAQPDPNASLGKYVSTTQLTDATLHNLFDVVTGEENAASTVDYRLGFWHNSNTANPWVGPVAWLSSETAGGATAAISVDTTAASAVGSASAQAKEIATETTAPTAQTFLAPTTKASGLPLGDVPVNNVKGIWIRRTAANSGALENDGVVIRVEGDTGAL